MSGVSGDVVPELETERTIMRGFRQSDLDAWATMAADGDAMRFVGGAGTRVEAWRSMAAHTGHWVLRGFGTWAVVHRDDGRLLGRVGLWEPEGWPAIEVGWVLARPAWGHGFAQESARAAMAWGFRELALERLISLIDAENVRSIRVAQRLGMAHDGQALVRGEPCDVWAVDAPVS
ncbi:MAG TPA: GNAT family N-acetyltransferase [Solirubrobacteraceae bacterium]|nr:GNAT family N-acetyltransferase [Solirubrobacteraceae bacterium]